jgi:uncharacterized Zn finger protein (UPF0148 family)
MYPLCNQCGLPASRGMLVCESCYKANQTQEAQQDKDSLDKIEEELEQKEINKESICEEALRITEGDRRNSYGDSTISALKLGRLTYFLSLKRE